MRIATWNVNSLKARVDKVAWWLDRIQPDVLLMQETKLLDKDAPIEFFKKAGYELAHHGEGSRNGVAIASKVGIENVLVNFGEPERITARINTTRIGAGAPKVSATDMDPMTEARMIAATCGGIRIICMYAPNGRVVGLPSYVSKLAWYVELVKWLSATHRRDDALIIGGDLNIAPTNRDVWDATKAHGGTHVSEPEREVFSRILEWGLTDSYRKHHPDHDGYYTWWDYRAGDFYKNFGMRIDHLLLTPPVAKRTVAAAIDREARKGKPTPSDHAPYVLDLDEPGRRFDDGWTGAFERIAARRAGKRGAD